MGMLSKAGEERLKTCACMYVSVCACVHVCLCMCVGVHVSLRAPHTYLVTMEAEDGVRPHGT